MILGIDASNIRSGGGVTHLTELLREIEPASFGIKRIVIWGGDVLKGLENRPWLEKRSPVALSKGILRRALWQRFSLSKVVRNEGCDVLFIPGGSYAGNFHPVVTMSRNLLPFDMSELKRYRWSFTGFRLLLLRRSQVYSFRRVDGLIFLTDYACKAVTRITGKLNAKYCIIPHGLNARFTKTPKIQYDITKYDEAHPYRILYVSIIDLYKHQWYVVEALAILRKLGLPIVLDLIGPAYLPALKMLNAAIAQVDTDRSWVHYHGAIAFETLHKYYEQADLGLFASSCENMPNILLETMASGLPIACSNRGPMPEVLGQAGVYFDPEQPKDIARALQELIESTQLRTKLSNASYELAQQFSWKRCAQETFQFLVDVKKQKDSKCAG